jgi:hypothetical protein
MTRPIESLLGIKLPSPDDPPSPGRLRFLAALDHYGIPHDDPRYDAPTDWSWWNKYGCCSYCGNHPASPMHSARCELRAARLKDIQAHGFDAETCYSCKDPYPSVTSRNMRVSGYCPSCNRAELESIRRYNEQTEKLAAEGKLKQVPRRYRDEDPIGWYEESKRHEAAEERRRLS